MTAEGKKRHQRMRAGRGSAQKRAILKAEEITQRAIECPAILTPPSNAIVLPYNWRPRPYQEEAWHYLFGNDRPGKLMVLNWHRRAGKDLFFLNAIIKATTRRQGMYWHCFPELKQGRRVVWEGYTKAGRKTLDHIPPEIRADVNQQELRINLKQGSTYMIIGGDDPDRNVGAGPVGIGFSEYAITNPRVWDLSSPMLGENGGWAGFISTPRGKNHFKTIYDYAANTPGCFAQTLTIEDTWHYDESGKRVPVITQEYLDRERAMGRSEEFLRQEYYCDWNSTLDGAIFSRDIRRMEEEGRICAVAYDSSLPVFTCWDLGFRDETVCLFYQIDRDSNVRIFDMVAHSNEPISYYCHKVNEKGYQHYETHWGPWDVGHRTIATGYSTLEIARQNGINFRRCPRHEVNDGLESIRAAFPRLWIDRSRCGRLVDALKTYRYEFDEVTKTFGDKPVHDWSSHYVDALRTGCFSLPRIHRPALIYQTREERRALEENEPSWDILN